MTTERKTRRKQIKTETVDPDVEVCDLTDNNNKKWTTSERQQLVDSVSRQFIGAKYKSYRDGIHDINWNLVDIGHRSESASKACLMEIISKSKKYRTLNEILMDYSDTCLNPGVRIPQAAEPETNVGKKAKPQNQTNQPQRLVSVETTRNVAKKRKPEVTQNNQTPREAEVESTEEVVKKSKREQKNHPTQRAASTIEIISKKVKPKNHEKSTKKSRPTVSGFVVTEE